MSTTATLAYVKGLLSGLAMPAGDPLVAYVMPPPVVDPPTLPATVYVWAGDGDEKRQTVPRGTPPAAGWKTTSYTVTLYLIWDSELDTADADTAFPGILDAVLARLRGSDDPATVTDPYTSATSVLVDVGERMTWTLYSPRALTDQRWVRMDAEIRVPVTEEFRA